MRSPSTARQLRSSSMLIGSLMFQLLIYRSFVDQSKSFTSTLRLLAISTKVSKLGCEALVHHLLTEAGSFPSCSASHLFVLFCSAKTTFSRLMSCAIYFFLSLFMMQRYSFSLKQSHILMVFYIFICVLSKFKSVLLILLVLTSNITLH